MQIDVNEKFKFASVWLTKEESKAKNVLVDLKPMMSEFQKKKYKFVIYYSGDRSLLETTKDLLSHNKNLGANIL